MKKSFVILFTLILLLLVSCDNNDGDFQKNYQLNLLLAYVNTPSDANAACVTLSKKQEECIAAPAVALGITVPLSSDSTLSSLCVNTLNSSSFNNMSAISQTCVLNCQITDWNQKISSGECRVATASNLIQSSLNNAVVTKCIRNCFATSNGLVSDSDLPKLFIFNFIQQGD